MPCASGVSLPCVLMWRGGGRRGRRVGGGEEGGSRNGRVVGAEREPEIKLGCSRRCHLPCCVSVYWGIRQFAFDWACAFI